jgi:hypothetical protein
MMNKPLMMASSRQGRASKVGGHVDDALIVIYQYYELYYSLDILRLSILV